MIEESSKFDLYTFVPWPLMQGSMASNPDLHLRLLCNHSLYAKTVCGFNRHLILSFYLIQFQINPISTSGLGLNYEI